MRPPDRAPRRRVGKREGGLIAAGIAAVGGAWLATRDGQAPEKPAEKDTAAATVPHVEHVRTPEIERPDAALENEDPNLSEEDLERAREHAAFKQRMADALSEKLPKEYTVMWVTSTDGRPEYNESLLVTGPNGKRMGDVYPDEVDGTLRFVADDTITQLYKDATGSPLAAFDSTDPAAVAAAVQDTERLSQYQTKWESYNQEWSGESKFVTAEDGSVQLSPDYVSQGNALKQQMSDAAQASETITTFDEQEERDEEAAEDDGE